MSAALGRETPERIGRKISAALSGRLKKYCICSGGFRRLTAIVPTTP
ncbi:hypothetical protein [Neisseria sp.]